MVGGCGGYSKCRDGGGGSGLSLTAAEVLFNVCCGGARDSRKMSAARADNRTGSRDSFAGRYEPLFKGSLLLPGGKTVAM